MTSSPAWNWTEFCHRAKMDLTLRKAILRMDSTAKTRMSTTETMMTKMMMTRTMMRTAKTAPPPLDIDNSEPNYRVVKDANGGERYEYAEVDPVYDSDDSDAQGPTNTIGNIPLSFYDSYPHIGYDINGKKIMRPATGEALDALLDSIEIPKGWTGLTDPETGKPLDLTQDQLELLKRLQMNEVP